MTKNTNFFARLGNSLKLWGRKKIIGLKRNYYPVPIIFIVISFIQFTFNLFVVSPNAVSNYAMIQLFLDHPENFQGIDAANYKFETGFNNVYSFIVFVITLLLILMVISFIYFIQNRTTEKKKWVFFSLYFVATIAAIVLSVCMIKTLNLGNTLQDVLLQKATAENDLKKIESVMADIASNNSVIRIMTTNIVLNAIAIVVAATSPLCQKLIRKVKFQRISTNEE